MQAYSRITSHENGVEMTSLRTDDETPTTLPAHAALLPQAANLNGNPHRGWYFAVMVRVAVTRLGGVA